MKILNRGTKKDTILTPKRSLEGKRCIITGATSGIGYQTARIFASEGARLILICRNLEKGEAVKAELSSTYHIPVTIIFADLNKLHTVKDAAYRILEEFDSIDILINNAGLFNTRLIMNESGLEETFCVNHLAPFLLTHLITERMIQSAPSRIIYVNSEAHRFSKFNSDDYNWKRHHYQGIKGYGSSKSASMLALLEKSELLDGTGVTINALHPGAIKSGIGKNNGRVYSWFSKHIVDIFMGNPVSAAKLLYNLATAPKYEKISGKYFKKSNESAPAAHACDRILSKEVYELSKILTGLTEHPVL